MTRPTLRGTIDVPEGDVRAGESPLLVLGPSLGTTTRVWSGVVEELRAAVPSFRILRYDLPGHGLSPAATESFSLAELAEAVRDLVDDAGGEPFHYAGLSLGGAIGIEIALTSSGRSSQPLSSLAVVCSNARISTPEIWADRARQVRSSGTPSLIGATPGRWFAADFIAREPEKASAALVELSERVDDESYALCAQALADFDRTADLGSIDCPTVVISASDDPVTTTAQLAELARSIPGATHVDIAAASHLVPYERPAEVAAILAGILATGTASPLAADSLMPSARDESVAERGMRIRREVLGDSHVDGAVAATTAETADFQDFITRYAWGEVWARPQLTRAQRSIATLASVVTGGHENETRMHVRAALRNGLTRSEITEVILQTALYAGLPAANGALAIARAVFDEQE